MANLLLTRRCVRTCPYCFARDHMSTNDLHAEVSWEDLIYVVDFFESSGEKRLSLLGGEPLLHRHFPDMVLYLLQRGFQVTVFTSAAIPQELTDSLRHFLPTDPEIPLDFVCNLNEPTLSPKKENECVEYFLEQFGTKCGPGFNIYRPDFDLTFLFDLVNRYGLKRHLRLGLAAPIPGADNQCLSISSIRPAMKRLLSFSEDFARNRLQIRLDCGFTLCSFTDEELGKLFKISSPLNFGCGPAIDIGPDMMVWSCFPLSRLAPRSLYEFSSLEELLDHFRSQMNDIRAEAGGIHYECDECQHREIKRCEGGCAAHILKAMKDEPFIRLPEINKCLQNL